LRTCYWNIII